MASYRLRVESAELDEDAREVEGDVNLKVFVEKDVAGEWVLVPGGHRLLTLDGDAVLAITESDATNQEKLTALKAMLKEKVVAWGIHISHSAYAQLYDLLPHGWPVIVEF